MRQLFPPRPNPHMNAHPGLQSLGTGRFYPARAQPCARAQEIPSQLPGKKHAAFTTRCSLRCRQSESLTSSQLAFGEIFLLNLLRMGPHFLLWLFKTAKKTLQHAVRVSQERRCRSLGGVMVNEEPRGARQRGPAEGHRIME